MIFSWEVKKQIWSLGKPKDRGLLGNKKRRLSLRKKKTQKREEIRKKRGGGFQRKREEIILSCYSSLKRETVERRK